MAVLVRKTTETKT